MAKELKPINDKHLIGIFDSHCHYDDHAFDDDRYEMIEAIHQNGVSHFVNIGCDIESCYTGIALAEKYDYFHCTVGIHPEASARTLEQHPDYLSTLKTLLQHEKVVALGEIGLDYYYDDGAPRDLQRLVFEQQLALAVEMDVPVVIHSRDAAADTMELLKKYRPKGVVHCFSGSPETAVEVVKLGMYVGFSGVLAFNNAKKAVACAEVVPNDRFLLETDCPYMAPTPFRGKRCQSDMIAHTAEKMAEIKGITVQEVLDLANENAKRLYGIL